MGNAFSTGFHFTMRYLAIAAIFFFGLFTSCNNTADNAIEYSLRDSVTKKHLELVDASTYSDTTDINYKVLKAYLANDTFFFKKLYADIEKERKYQQQYKINDSCIHQAALPAINADEAYRFVYTAAFCQYKLNVTISKTGNTSNIHFIIWQDVWLNKICKVINEYDKKITEKDWEDFSQLMKKADFWGLKSTNGVQGLDGSTLITTGFTKGYRTYEGKPKYNYVYRWGYSTLSDPFNFVLKLSGNTQGCLVVK